MRTDEEKAATREDYNAIQRESWSRLRRIQKSPAHYKHGPEEETDPQRLGTLAHLLVLEPHRASEVAVWGLLEEQKVRRGKVWDAFEAENAGKMIVTDAEMETAADIAMAVHSDPVAAPLLTGGAAEVSILWEFDGLPFKSRLDYVRPDALVDLKKVQDASPDGFSKSIWNYRLDSQAALYQRAYAEMTGLWLPFYWVAVEEKAPCVVQVYRCPGDMIADGMRHARRLVETLKFCRATDSWPAYGTGVMEAAYPRFAAQALEDAAAEDVS